MNKKEWKKVNNNEVISFDWGYLSYNPQTTKSPLTDLANIISTLGDLGKTFIDGEETAIFSREKNDFYILEGDFRKELEACETLEECLVIYNNNKDKQSNWSVGK